MDGRGRGRAIEGERMQSVFLLAKQVRKKEKGIFRVDIVSLPVHIPQT